MNRNKIIVLLQLVILLPSISAYGDVTSADSPEFAVNLLFIPAGGSYDYADSGSFNLSLLKIRREWSDSSTFAYMYANASAPPDSAVLQKTGMGTLYLADTAHPLDTNKPTIVLTHGWNPPLVGGPSGQMPDWIEAAVENFFTQPYADNWNIVWWDWLQKAKAVSPAGPAKQTQWQGNYLAEALVNTFGFDYDQYIHFIGHSLGTSVNRWAADVLHNNGWDWHKTHVTIFDAAELGDLSIWVEPIPTNAAYIDSYITAFGKVHTKARNVILHQGVPILPTDIMDYVDFHGYAADWYNRTISDPLSSYMGFYWSFEHGGVANAPSEMSCYAQTINPWDDEGQLEQISYSDAQSRLRGRTVMQVGQVASLVYAAATGSFKMLGEIVLDTAKEKITAKLKEVLLTASEGGFESMASGTSPTSSYLWIPLQIPYGVDLMTFDYCFSNCSDGDYITVSIGDEQVFVMEARFAENGVYSSSSYIDIGGLSGKNIEIAVAFNCDDIPGGELDVTNFQFHSTAVAMDLNKDGLVNLKDLAVFTQQWYQDDCNDLNDWCEDCDFDRNAVVDMNDLGVITSSWLRDAGDPNTW